MVHDALRIINYYKDCTKYKDSKTGGRGRYRACTETPPPAHRRRERTCTVGHTECIGFSRNRPGNSRITPETESSSITYHLKTLPAYDRRCKLSGKYQIQRKQQFSTGFQSCNR